MKKIGIVGCGTIGSYLAKRINKDFKGSAKIAGICDVDMKKAKVLQKKLRPGPPIFPLDRLIPKSDILIEAASGTIAPIVCKKAIENSKAVMIMSIGGLIKDYKSLFLLAKKKDARIIFPSGAICGLDGLKSAACAKINKVTLITRKPPQGLKDAPYISENKIDLDSVKDEQVVFDGTAEEAIRGFPKNVNVCALLSIAGLGAKKTKVKIITSPEYMVNMHEVEVEGDFGKLTTCTENIPFSENPKTSFLAALSALSTLEELIYDTVKIGT
jgi:aspartate dehydrogenase